MKLATKFLEETLGYDGTQLISHFVFEKTGVLGNQCVAFVGPCRVTLDHMVDLEDVRNRESIYSPQMLHFILEDFHLNLSGGVLLQRLMVCLMAEALQTFGVKGLVRRGDDLYWEEKKLNISITTRSPVSTLIHLGINVETQGTPVPTAGLADWDISPEVLAKTYLQKLKLEYEQFRAATYKVRPVG